MLENAAFEVGGGTESDAPAGTPYPAKVKGKGTLIPVNVGVGSFTITGTLTVKELSTAP